MPTPAKPEFVLTAEQRSRLVPNLDVDALQQLIQIGATSDEGRNALLQAFSKNEVPNMSFQIVGVVSADPTMQTLLEEVWAPIWESKGLEEIEHSDARMPGRELARARLMAKRRPSTDK